MAWIAPVVAAGASLLGSASASGDAKKSRDAQKKALAQYAGVEVPEIADQQVFYDLMTNAGTMTPELEQALGLQPSAMENISTDPRLRQQQMNALAQLAGISETGMSPADQAAFELARRGAASENQAMQGQILQNMQARGQGGSGAELIARLKGAQSSADAMQAAQLEQAKQQQAARMQALNQVGSMASGIQNQDFNQAAQVAQAKDLINKFNVQNQQNVNNQNVAAKNAAQLTNLQNQQQIMNSNTGIRNTQQDRNKALLQQDFNNRMAKASGMAGQYNGISQTNQQQAANTASMYGQIGQGLGTAIGGYFNQKNDENKTDGTK
jgi:hypothetical protein